MPFSFEDSRDSTEQDSQSDKRTYNFILQRKTNEVDIAPLKRRTLRGYLIEDIKCIEEIK